MLWCLSCSFLNITGNLYLLHNRPQLWCVEVNCTTHKATWIAWNMVWWVLLQGTIGMQPSQQMMATQASSDSNICWLLEYTGTVRFYSQCIILFDKSCVKANSYDYQLKPVCLMVNDRWSKITNSTFNETTLREVATSGESNVMLYACLGTNK